MWVFKRMIMPSDQAFNMRAALMWTVNDLPTYGMVFGWSTAGIMGCPICINDTRTFYLQHDASPAVEKSLTIPSGYGSDHTWTGKSSLGISILRNASNSAQP
ncbi:UNVERIFIED_CONTAM: hypothetical protein Sangu_2849700 [Sesamum angustifolium]|uniref:Uncharacterized protein n=1 Tax=Sesamum angustifolium TaxID=2727405 RepID=A0AAW2IR68_9LAMI